LVECFRPDRTQCSINGACRLSAVFREALTAWLAVLDGTTLADLVGRNRNLVKLLRRPA
jgi:Rrf2 family nitric oxide-sensitive transcriptional repressor